MLSAHSSLRREVVPARTDADGDGDEPAQLALAFGDAGSSASNAPEETAAEPPRKPWAWLLGHVFRQDVTTCEKCGGQMRWIEVATTAEHTARLIALEHGGSVGARPPRARPRVPPEQMAFGFT